LTGLLCFLPSATVWSIALSALDRFSQIGSSQLLKELQLSTPSRVQQQRAHEGPFGVNSDGLVPLVTVPLTLSFPQIPSARIRAMR
jgi:hypothetical protein